MALGVRMNGVRPNVRLILQEPIENIDGFPDSAGYKMRKQGDVSIRDMVITDTAIASIRNVIFREKILLI